MHGKLINLGFAAIVALISVVACSSGSDERSPTLIADEVSDMAENFVRRGEDCDKQFSDGHELRICQSDAAVLFADSIFIYVDGNFDAFTFENVPKCLETQLSNLLYVSDALAFHTVIDEFAHDSSDFDADRATALAFSLAPIHAREVWGREVALRAMFELETPFPDADFTKAQQGLVQLFRDEHQSKASSPALISAYLKQLSQTMSDLELQAASCKDS